MAVAGGKIPYDSTAALTGPARVLWADPAVTTAPANIWDAIANVANGSGEYPAKTGWTDFGFAADAPSYSHNTETEGIEYEGLGELFQKVSNIERSFTAQVAGIQKENLAIIENSTTTAAVTASAAAAPDRHAAVDKVFAGTYSALRSFRIILVSFRPDGAGIVTEAGTPAVTRPPMVARIIPLCTLAAEDRDVEFSAGDAVNVEVSFTAVSDQTQGAGKEHGFWSVEQPGTILA